MEAGDRRISDARWHEIAVAYNETRQAVAATLREMADYDPEEWGVYKDLASGQIVHMDWKRTFFNLEILVGARTHYPIVPYWMVACSPKELQARMQSDQVARALSGERL